ncbi:MAG: hypothetical protein QOD77_2141 [Thermoplasmata archaeon]|jgi:hypothetical protein|nr:hypothetical protein [Thermoplasmata archaeon]
MTKPAVRLAACAMLAALLAAPAVQAHGAPVPRTIDTRVLADDDGALGFGGCVPEVGCQADGIDLLALDVREAADALGRPMIAFRVIFQTELDSLAGTSFTLSFTAGGQAKTATVTLADGNATSPDAVRVEGPVPVGDQHPQAVDVWFHSQPLGIAPGGSTPTLGTQPGDAITEIRVTSQAGADGANDAMPGTWTTRGQAVPFLPEDPEPSVPEPAPAGNYTVAGPARLLNATAPSPVLVHHGNATAKVTLRSTVDLPQFASLRLDAAGANATLDAAVLNLPDLTARDVTVTIQSAAPGATLALLVSTDLGGFERIPIPLMVEEERHEHTDPTAQGSETEPAPALAPGVTLAVLALAALARRR